MRRDGSIAATDGWCLAFAAARLAEAIRGRLDLGAYERNWLVCCALGERDAAALRAACALPWG